MILLRFEACLFSYSDLGENGFWIFKEEVGGRTLIIMKPFLAFPEDVWAMTWVGQGLRGPSMPIVQASQARTSSHCQMGLGDPWLSQLRNWVRMHLNKAAPLCSFFMNVCCNPFMHPEPHWNVFFNLISQKCVTTPSSSVVCSQILVRYYCGRKPNQWIFAGAFSCSPSKSFCVLLVTFQQNCICCFLVPGSLTYKHIACLLRTESVVLSNPELLVWPAEVKVLAALWAQGRIVPGQPITRSIPKLRLLL